MSEKILVLDDECAIADLLEVYLKSESYTVYKCYTAKAALACVENEDVDLAILDVMLPDMDGFTICQKIREKHTFPIIMLTAKGEQTDKITGLTLGADDYMTKPFQPLELVTRVKAQLRRYKKYNLTQQNSQSGEVIAHAGLTMNIRTYDCRLDGEALALTPTEFSILRILLERKGSVVSAEEIFHELWQDEYYMKGNNTVSVHIRHLRMKLNDTTDDPRYIKTVWGVGYKIESL